MIPLQDTPFLSPLLRAYFTKDAALQPFYTLHPTAQDWTKTIENCLQNYAFSRELLVQNILSQYEKEGVALTPQVQKNIALLAEKNTLSICTGHQLNLFTGPFYTIVKVVQTILLAEELQQKYPQFRFVPLYWMASEDHDFAEINHFYCFDKKFTWEKSTNAQPVGRIALHEKDDASFAQFIAHLQSQLNEKDFSHPWLQKIITCYQNAENLAAAQRAIFDFLFADKGLIVLNADEPTLKKVLVQEVQQELQHSALQQTLLAKPLPFTWQVRPRKINLFYVQNEQRLRVEREGEEVMLLPTQQKLNIDPAFVAQNIGQFSPNVLLRPIYQQRLLPNLAYIGGAAEVAYWLQLKPHFDAIGLFYPVLVPRVSALLYRQAALQKLQSFGFSLLDVLQKKEELPHIFAQRSLAQRVQFSFDDFQTALDKLAAHLAPELEKIDATLLPRLAAEKVKFSGQIAALYDKMQKAQKQKLETQLLQIQKIVSAILPSGALRERKMNFLEWVWQHPSENLLEVLYAKMQPLQFETLLELG